MEINVNTKTKAQFLILARRNSSQHSPGRVRAPRQRHSGFEDFKPE
jgi:hypothetical protein